MIYNVNLKRNKALLSIGLIFTIIGAIFLILFGTFVFLDLSKKKSLDGEIAAYDVEWSSHINDEGNELYSPTYYYEVNGNKYICTSNSSSSTKSGKGIVYYDTTNPSKCMTDFESNSSFLFMIFLIIPLLFIIIGLFFIRKYINRNKVIKRLAYDGVLVKGIPCQIVNSNISLNNVPLKCLSISYKFPDGNIRNLKSDPLHIINSNLMVCDLLYDANNYNNYYIDWEIIPTGFGSPNIIYYQQMDSTYVNSDASEYNISNKF